MTDNYYIPNTRIVNIIGNVYDRLTVISYYGKSSHKKSLWICKCVCGNTAIIPSGSLKSGNSKSCGCRNIEQIISRNTTHLLSNSDEYKIWAGIKKRCTNPKSQGYNNYGGRGIIMSDRWINSFECFYNDMGIRPSKKHSIDRIDVNGNYEPSNCRWATQKEQSNNMRKNIKFNINGEIISAKEMAARNKIKYGALLWRIRNGWSHYNSFLM